MKANCQTCQDLVIAKMKPKHLGLRKAKSFGILIECSVPLFSLGYLWDDAG